MLYNMTQKVLFIFQFFIIRVTYSKHFDETIIEINTFHTTDCQFYPFQHTTPWDFEFCFVNIKTRKKEKKSNVFMISVAEFTFFIKNIVSSAQAVYRKLWLNIFRPSILLFVLIKTKAITKTKMKRYAEIGSPCRVLLSSLKQRVVFPAISDTRFLVFK